MSRTVTVPGLGCCAFGRRIRVVDVVAMLLMITGMVLMFRGMANQMPGMEMRGADESIAHGAFIAFTGAAVHLAYCGWRFVVHNCRLATVEVGVGVVSFAAMAAMLVG